MEFDRLLYPLRYNIFIRVLNENPIKILFEKDDNNMWHISDKENTAEWINKMYDEIHAAIEENEIGSKVH